MFLAVRCTITGRFRVCHNKRITRNKVFRDYAERGKSTMGWYFGFKLHLICNERGEQLNFIPNPNYRFGGCLEGITDMVGSIQEFLQRQARHIEERDAILLHQRLELILLQVLLAFAQFIEIK